ncbi:PDPFL protein, partial [Penelope pileata]|nr:PDPFL protein [Penelope pileata]
MASVPSAGSLLAKNQYYRSKCSGLGSPPASVRRLRAVSLLSGLPELLDKCWWIKNFFHCEPSPPTVGRKTLSAS